MTGVQTCALPICFPVTIAPCNINAGNITGGNLVTANFLAGTLTTAAQPNITSVGTLTSLGVNGTVTAVAFTANTGSFTGNGADVSSLAGANVTGTVSNATYATSAGSATTAGTVTTNAQPNITSVGAQPTMDDKSTRRKALPKVWP